MILSTLHLLAALLVSTFLIPSFISFEARAESDSKDEIYRSVEKVRLASEEKVPGDWLCQDGSHLFVESSDECGASDLASRLDCSGVRDVGPVRELQILQLGEQTLVRYFFVQQTFRVTSYQMSHQASDSLPQKLSEETLQIPRCKSQREVGETTEGYKFVVSGERLDAYPDEYKKLFQRITAAGIQYISGTALDYDLAAEAIRLGANEFKIRTPQYAKLCNKGFGRQKKRTAGGEGSGGTGSLDEDLILPFDKNGRSAKSGEGSGGWADLDLLGQTTRSITVKFTPSDDGSFGEWQAVCDENALEL